ncbi:GTPase Era [Echinimonas agarilytica]|uniref:GTPase Era n=1 Tax=Echinimonas agarilytica TaxID=1215918 RepID=A0AA41W5I7_9GAMM|nr:GTPase Era [Echinimonas agarilytica]MCM2678823.1 GTPase Era [Echinimonas agarilytica]
MTHQRAGMVAIVGRPNVGKSTLLNNVLGQKVSITSKKPQTTRHRIMGIFTEAEKQVVFVDTPGLHIEEKRAINRLMNRAASSGLADVEMVVFVSDGDQWTEDDDMVVQKLRALPKRVKVIAVINKVDLIKDKATMLPVLQRLSDQMSFAQIMPISAEKGTNIDTLMAYVLDNLPECEHFFPEDYITDRSSRFMAAEIVREKLMRFTGDELPYSVTVEIERFVVNEKGIAEINALVLVEREGQKRMVIGKGGEKLKVIGRDARLDMERLFDQKVFLQIWVKVKSGWADDERALRSLGYGED